jgi:hypothetical protein
MYVVLGVVLSIIGVRVAASASGAATDDGMDDHADPELTDGGAASTPNAESSPEPSQAERDPQRGDS